MGWPTLKGTVRIYVSYVNKEVKMNKIIKELMGFSHYGFVVLGIILLGLKLNLHKWIIFPFAVLYTSFVLVKFELKEN